MEGWSGRNKDDSRNIHPLQLLTTCTAKMVLHLSAFDAVNLLLRDVTFHGVRGLNNKWILQQQWSSMVKRSHPGVVL